ncbi:MAG TPA: hypothetical protein HPP77_06090 [Candidatus Hydrogenedentes bacterium]|nr:hypothetical protein [Candidatus Hydrogenedentota bacterium]HIJ73857.1 hypothetical protein [Candidatus Hydrogenedentota bacterium]
MAKWLVLVVAIAPGLGACSGGDGKAQPAAVPKMSQEEAQKAAEALVGTTWLVEEYTVTFKEPPEVHVQGGPLDETDPEGITGEYAFENGVVKVNVAGETRTGTWDGESLTVDGLQAKRL